MTPKKQQYRLSKTSEKRKRLKDLFLQHGPQDGAAYEILRRHFVPQQNRRKKNLKIIALKERELESVRAVLRQMGIDTGSSPESDHAKSSDSSTRADQSSVADEAKKLTGNLSGDQIEGDVDRARQALSSDHAKEAEEAKHASTAGASDTATLADTAKRLDVSDSKDKAAFEAIIADAVRSAAVKEAFSSIDRVVQPVEEKKTFVKVEPEPSVHSPTDSDGVVRVSQEKTYEERKQEVYRGQEKKVVEIKEQKNKKVYTIKLVDIISLIVMILLVIAAVYFFFGPVVDGFKDLLKYVLPASAPASTAPAPAIIPSSGFGG